MSAAVQLEDLSRRFGTRTVLDRLRFSVEAGTVVALMGENGAGKSTLLDLVCGLTRPSSGSIRVLGGPPAEAVRAGRVGAMLQSGGLLEDLTVGETAQLFVELFGRRVATAQLLDEVGLAELTDRPVRLCSGGERQRLRWALAKAPRPELFVLDEPTAGMDWLARRDFWRQVRQAARDGATVLYSSHYADEVELADRLVLLSGGRVVLDASPAEVVAAAPDGRSLFDGLGLMAGRA